MGDAGGVAGHSYEIKEQIGSGAYSTVFRAERRLEGGGKESFAVKSMRFDDGVPVTLVREITIMRNLSHANVVGYYGATYNNRTLMLLMEYCTGNLGEYLEKKGPLPLARARGAVAEVLAAVAYCHENQVIHRDLKPANVLVTTCGHLKISDFGLARTAVPFFSMNFTAQVVTLWYRAPEIIMGSLSYSFAVDVWSVACIAIEMVTGEPAFPGNSEIDTLFKIFKVAGTPCNSTWRGVESLDNYNVRFPSWTPTPLEELIPHAATDEDGVALIRAVVGMLILDPVNRLSAVGAVGSLGQSVTPNDDVLSM